MGNYFYKYQETEKMLSPRVVDKKKEYNVYVVAYANKSNQSIGSKFAKFCIHDLSLSWPETIISPIDEYPFLADLCSFSQDSSLS